MTDAPRPIDTLRAGAGQRVDPAGLRRIEALARRAAAHQGECRRLLDERLAQLCAARQLKLQREGLAVREPASAEPSPLSGLLAHMAELAGPHDAEADLKTLHRHRGMWARLQLDLTLAQALAREPDNAGPLNTQRLLNQALQWMRGAAPQYLQHFMAHAEALLWLDQASLPGVRQGDGAKRRIKPPR